MLAAVLTVYDPPAPKSRSRRPAPPAGPGGEGPAAAPLPAQGPEDFAAVVRMVVAAVMRLPHDHADVDDGVSETMRRALEGRARLRPGEPLRPWMLGIARHVAIDAIRRRGRERPASAPLADRDSAGDVSLLDVVPDSAPSPLDRAVEADQTARVRRAMAELPEGMREALVLFHVDGLGYEAIAAKMGVPLGTVATWIARGRKTLTLRMNEAEERSAR